MFYSGQHVDSLERVLVEQLYEMLGTSLDFCIDFEWEANDIHDDQDVKGVRGVLKTTHSHSQVTTDPLLQVSVYISFYILAYHSIVCFFLFYNLQ